MAVTIDDIRAAADRLERKVVRTPTLRSDALSALCGANIVLKLENLQLTGVSSLNFQGFRKKK